MASRKPQRRDDGFVLRDRSGKVHQPKSGWVRKPERDRDREQDRETGPDTGRAPVLPKSKKTKEKTHWHSAPKKKKEKAPPKGHLRRGPARTYKGTVDKHRKGFGFLIFENRKMEDAFIPPQIAQDLFQGDRVEVTLDGRGNISELEVIEHRFTEAVGKYYPHPTGNLARGATVIYERKKAREEIHIAQGVPFAKAGDWVRTKLLFDDTEDNHGVQGQVLESYGPDLPARVDIPMVAAEYGLVEEHPSGAEREAKEFKLEMDFSYREDLREVPFITIDGETARDFDDAIFVEREKSGFILWVAIADVSHYVKPGTALDASALSRGTSVYFPEKAFHMLPRALSENLCSLRPNEPRLSMVAKMRFDYQGKRTSTELFEAVIESKRRATYNEIEAEHKESGKKKDWEFAPHFSLYALIRKERSGRGSIDFDLPEAEVRVDEKGEPVSIRNRERLESHRLIEEFMVSANEAVTEWIMERNWPFIYRVHEEPSARALEEFEKLAATAGVAVTVARKKDLNLVLSEIVERLEDHPASAMLNMALLRSMKRAVYSAAHGIHFGLASKAYTHFTSPIRRYPDLLVHRMLRHALRAEKKLERTPSKKELGTLEEQLAENAEHCSYRERLASDAERDSIKLKQIRMAKQNLGGEFTGKINGMIESGFFVVLEDPYLEGMVSQDSMNDDFYQFNEERMIFYGKRKRRTFKIGDKVHIRIVRADIEERTIDFELVETPTR